jgi:tripartite-type tricarboxylate transporter receptor subunit TctC
MGMFDRRLIAGAALGFGVLAVVPGPVSAQLSQSQPIRIVLGLAPGGATDVGARVVGKAYTDQTGQQVIIENRAGGGGAVSAMAVKASAPDGHTLVLMDNGACCANTLLTNVAYDTLRDFKPVLLLWGYPTILVVPESSPVKSVADLVALGRSRPQGLTYASQGVGAGGHIMGAMFGRAAKIGVVHVPYRGATPAATDVAAGRADFLFASYASVHPFINDHRIRPIATTGDKGENAVPGYGKVQTMIEAGYPDVRLNAWFALYAPIGTSDDVVQQLHQRFAKALRSPPVVQRLSGLNMEVSMDSTAAELGTKVKDEIIRLRPILSDLLTKSK